MKIVFDETSLLEFIEEAKEVAQGHPILIDKFINDAIEIDVDAVSDGSEVFVAGIMEHIESAGIHSGDSACCLPPPTLNKDQLSEILNITEKIAIALKVIGLLNIQFAVKEDKIYVLEVNPRASRTSPFVSKAIGIPLAKIAAQIMAGKTLADFDLKYDYLEDNKHYSVKECVLPFSRFSGVDIVLGPEMKSTGEVMGISTRYGEAFAKSQVSAGSALPDSGKVFLSVRDEDKPEIVLIAKALDEMGFGLVTTSGTAKTLIDVGLVVEEVEKYKDGQNTDSKMMAMIKSNEIALVINTPSDQTSETDMRLIRAAAILQNIPCITTIQGAQAAVKGLRAKQEQPFTVKSLQEYHQQQKDTPCAA